MKEETIVSIMAIIWMALWSALAIELTGCADGPTDPSPPEPAPYDASETDALDASVDDEYMSYFDPNCPYQPAPCGPTGSGSSSGFPPPPVRQ